MSNLILRPSIFTFVAVLSFLVGCSFTEVDCVCSTEFVYITVSAVDTSDSPVTDLDINVRVNRTGDILNVKQEQYLIDRGVYIVFHDGFKHTIPAKVNILGEELTVTGVGTTGRFEASFQIAVDSECACHVHMKSGPGEVVVED